MYYSSNNTTQPKPSASDSHRDDGNQAEGKQIDDLQVVMQTIRGMEWEAPLVFENMR